MHHGVLKGVIYLENNFSADVFTEQRLEIVKMLCSQAAISLENARLYDSLLLDIEQRQKVEKDLKNSEEMARSLLDGLEDGLVLTDPQGTVLSLNTTAAERFGKPRQQLIGRCIWKLFPADVATRRKCMVDRAVLSGRPLRVADEWQGKMYDSVIYPILDSKGKASKIAVLARDVTQQRKMELQAEIQQRQLLGSSKLAFLGELAVGVAHEINNPNHSIMLDAALLLRASPDILAVLDDYNREDKALRIGGLEYAEFRETLSKTVARIDSCAKKIDLIVKEL